MAIAIFASLGAMAGCNENEGGKTGEQNPPEPPYGGESVPGGADLVMELEGISPSRICRVRATFRAAPQRLLQGRPGRSEAWAASKEFDNRVIESKRDNKAVCHYEYEYRGMRPGVWTLTGAFFGLVDARCRADLIEGPNRYLVRNDIHDPGIAPIGSCSVR